MLNTADAPLCLFKLDLRCHHEFLAEMSTFSFSPCHCKMFSSFSVCWDVTVKKKKNPMPKPSRADTKSHLLKRSNCNKTEATVAALLADASADWNTNANRIMQRWAQYHLGKKKKHKTKCKVSIYYSGRTKKKGKRNWCVALDPLGPTSRM